MQTDTIMQTLTNTITPKFAVSYLRVSTPGQAERGGGADEGFSIPAQREANKKKALSMGAMVGKEFVDRGASARSADRPELQKMLEYVKDNSNRIDYVIVHKVDRLARNRGDDIDITRVLREANVKLVSASESIDETPAGMLLHGIMSSIAEFYSLNLANEVRKGMDEKVKNGGTISKAPIGYTNVRRVDDRGRAEKAVELDEQRAPFIKLAFEEFATGNWTVNSLAEHLAMRGFVTRNTPRITSTPVNKGLLNKIFINPYYKGSVVYQGVEYQGNHTPITDTVTWQKVQDVLASHVNGERDREHPHFLRGMLYCRSCGSRMIVTYARSKTGVTYPYYICAGRHSKRHNTACTQKAVLIEAIEAQVEQIYRDYSLQPEMRMLLEKVIAEEIEKYRGEFEAEQSDLQREKEKLERKRKKLLEAHYNDAIPLDLLKSEQEKIGKALTAIEQKMQAFSAEYDTIFDNLRDAFDLLENCGHTYMMAGEHIRKIFNKALFEHLWVERDGKVSADLAEPFSTIAQPERGIAAIRSMAAKGIAAISDFLGEIANPAQFLFGQGLTKSLLVIHRGFEPRTP